MGLRIYNTLTRQKETFEPLIPGQARMYVCGITAYDLSHIGHARSALVFDVIRRHLEFRGYRVLFVRNFTDVDDKIIKRAEQEGLAAKEVAERYIGEYHKDMEKLRVLPATVEPKATEYIPQMIALIERLVGRGFAYAVDGDVYFEVRRFLRYGRLSGKHLDELLPGARVAVVDVRCRDSGRERDRQRVRPRTLGARSEASARRAGRQRDGRGNGMDHHLDRSLAHREEQHNERAEELDEPADKLN